MVRLNQKIFFRVVDGEGNGMGGLIVGMVVGAFLGAGMVILCIIHHNRSNLNHGKAWIDDACEKAIEAADRPVIEV
jgi:hypothetical protein